MKCHEMKKLNAISRLVIILTILGYLITQSVNFFITGIVTLGILFALYYTKKSEDKETTDKSSIEGFTNPRLYKQEKSEIYKSY